MKPLKPILIFLCILIVVGFVLVFNHDRHFKQPPLKICEHEYALCTSAKCIPDPSNPGQAVCFCDVKEGKSMSTTRCKNLKPKTDSKGIRTVYSTYSLDQYLEGKKGMQCPDGTPWSWCLNKKCTVDPMDPKKAVCVCDIMHEGEWVTLGGNCDTTTCQTGYWSGATVESIKEASDFLIKELGVDPSNLKSCSQ